MLRQHHCLHCFVFDIIIFSPLGVIINTTLHSLRCRQASASRWRPYMVTHVRPCLWWGPHMVAHIRWCSCLRWGPHKNTNVSEWACGTRTRTWASEHDSQEHERERASETNWGETRILDWYVHDCHWIPWKGPRRLQVFILWVEVHVLEYSGEYLRE